MWVAIGRGNAGSVAMRPSRRRITPARMSATVHPVARWFPVHVDHLLKVAIGRSMETLSSIDRQGISMLVNDHDRFRDRSFVRIPVFAGWPWLCTDCHILSAKQESSLPRCRPADCRGRAGQRIAGL